MTTYEQPLKWRGAEKRKAAKVAAFFKEFLGRYGREPNLREIGENFKKSRTWGSHYLTRARGMGLLEAEIPRNLT